MYEPIDAITQLVELERIYSKIGELLEELELNDSWDGATLLQ
jgi:hypothetical protein